MKIEVRLFANLRSYLPPGSDGTKARLDMPDGTRLRDVIDRLAIPSPLAQLVMVNGEHVADRERALTDGSVLSIFPPVAGGERPVKAELTGSRTCQSSETLSSGELRYQSFQV